LLIGAGFIGKSNGSLEFAFWYSSSEGMLKGGSEKDG
jgi:hypothetical protein